MPRDLFGDVTRPSISVGNRKWYTVPVSLLSHSAIVLAFVVIPLLASDTLPKPWETITVVIDVPSVPTPPPAPRRPAEVTPRADPSIPPTEAPEGFTPEKPVEHQPFETETPGIVGGVDNVDHIIEPPPPLPPPPVPQKPLRVSGAKAAQKIKEVAPVYPAFALAARVQGTVIIEATIGADGRVVDARVLRSVPMLDQAALDAVRQWEYRPTLLNGVPVPVIMTVTVTFSLTR